MLLLAVQFFFAHHAAAQNSQSDSVSNILKTAAENSNKVKMPNESETPQKSVALPFNYSKPINGD